MSSQVTFVKNKQIYLRIKKIGINDCLGCSSVDLELQDATNTHLLLYKVAPDFKRDAETAVTPVVQAVQLLCTNIYPDASSLNRVPLLKIGRGSVSVTFLVSNGQSKEQLPQEAAAAMSDDELDEGPSTSKQARLREEMRQQRRQQRQWQQQQQAKYQNAFEVTASRYFDDVYGLDKIIFSIQNSPLEQVTVETFHDMFFASPQHSDPLLCNLLATCGGNWLRVIRADNDSYACFKGDRNPFEIFAQLYEKKEFESDTFVFKLATECILSNEATRIAERGFVLQVFDLVRHLFEYITVGEYTVWFFVPRLKCYEKLQNVTVDDLDLSSVKTSIKRVNDTSNYFFRNADNNTRDMLLIAFQLALAHISNQSVLVLTNMEKLAEHMCMKFVTAAFMNQRYPSANKWICQKYLERIMCLCHSLDMIIFIEYPGTLTLLPENTKVIKCKQQQDQCTEGIFWSVYEDTTKNNWNLPDINATEQFDFSS